MKWEPYLVAINNKCRCGAVAKGIKEESEKGTRIVGSLCDTCGLKYTAFDLRIFLTESMQKKIRILSY